MLYELAITYLRTKCTLLLLLDISIAFCCTGDNKGLC